MPTCEYSTVRLIDRSGSLSRDAAKIKLTFAPAIIGGGKVIARLQILDDPKASALSMGDIMLPNASWRMWGTCEAGQGQIVVNETSQGERIFLITKLRPRTAETAEPCCEPVEVVCGASLADFTNDEMLLIIRRLLQLAAKGTTTGPLDCSPPELPA